MDKGMLMKFDADTELNNKARMIHGDLPYNDVKRMIRDLNRLALKKYCMKGYLEACEPEYCMFRISDSCEYVYLIKYLYDKYKIDIVMGEMKNA